MLHVFMFGVAVKIFLTEAHKKEFWDKEVDLKIDDEKDCEEEELKSTKDNFLLWKIFQEEP